MRKIQGLCGSALNERSEKRRIALGAPWRQIIGCVENEKKIDGRDIEQWCLRGNSQVGYYRKE